MWSKADPLARKANMRAVLELTSQMKKLDPDKQRYNAFHWEGAAHIFLYMDTKIESELDEARKAFEQSFAIWPEQTKDRFNLAEVELMAGHYERTAGRIQEMNRLTQQHSKIDVVVSAFLLGLAQVLDKNATDPDYDECLNTLKGFVETDPDIYVTTDIAAYVRGLKGLSDVQKARAESLLTEMQRICDETSPPMPAEVAQAVN
jgi:hypothetical protein